MGVKSDKTFEEIVERLVALFRPQPETRSEAPQPQPASAEPADASSSAVPSTSSDREPK